MASQRDIMRKLWRQFGPDRRRVVQEYAQAELLGRVSRVSNRSGESHEQYAERLLYDGIKKGWLVPPDGGVEAQPGSSKAYNRSRRKPVDLIEARSTPDPVEESTEYLDRINAWRSAWRSARVRGLLVAESHVAEQPGDLSVRVHLPHRQQPIPERLPAGYCRLVYCLGYGENELCTPTRPYSNSGTWQFWDLFGAIAASGRSDSPTQMPRKNTSTLHQRLAWKLAVLRMLRDRGIWLVDASVSGLYLPGGGRAVNGVAYRNLVRSSFLREVWPSVQHEPIDQVWVIGRGVGQALDGLPGICTDRVISQPQDRDGGRYQSDLARLATEFQAVR